MLGLAIVLAFGVNLLADGVGAHMSTTQSLVVGAAVILLLIALVAIVQLRRLEETVTFRGFVALYDNEVLDISRYSFAEDLHRVLRAVTSENEALNRQWRDDPVMLRKSAETAGRDRFNPGGAGAQLLREAIEFVYLEHLSMHLSEYFDKRGLEDLCQEHERKDLLPLLPENRVLDMLSRPLEDRIALLEGDSATDRHFVQITRRRASDTTGPEDVLIWATDGTHIFTRLDLILPRDVRVLRVAPGRIALNGKALKTELGVSFEGFGYNLDGEFLSFYAKRPAREFFGHGESLGQVFQVTLTFHARITWRGLWTARGWRLHRWAESFAQSEKTKADAASFLESINWETARTMILSGSLGKWRAEPGEAITPGTGSFAESQPGAPEESPQPPSSQRLGTEPQQAEVDWPEGAEGNGRLPGLNLK
ncbi:hypothetical protein [Geodermatophilus sp. DSM 45219]|uniref:hypothetical protein n=1 Tax=Geodermatophilus sp. DSM 45219 TaxID=1881103 RepID=UPI00115FD304|nr:hypothetical protein [Geodermatophilus sp. DSM 45219]